MRHCKTIVLNGTRTVTVKELRVKDVRRLLAGFKNFQDWQFAELCGDRFGEVSALLDGCISWPDGEGLDDLTASELQQVVEGLKEVNRYFLDLAGLLPAEPAAETLTPLTEPLSA